MINKIIGNTLYIFSTLLLCTLTYLLNHCTKITECALVFTMIAITVNTVTVSCGRFKSLIGLGFAIVISFIFLMKLPYYINGRIVNGLVFASFSSLIISLYLSTSAFLKFRNRFSFIVSNFLFLIIASIIDGILMSLFFTLNHNFSYATILDLFKRELSYKILYGFIISVIVFVVLKMFKTSLNLRPRGQPTVE